MKKYITPFTNWRIIALTILGIIAFILLCGETDSLATFALIKVSGFGIAYLTYRLGSYWRSQGLIDEIETFNANE